MSCRCVSVFPTRLWAPGWTTSLLTNNITLAGREKYLESQSRQRAEYRVEKLNSEWGVEKGTASHTWEVQFPFSSFSSEVNLSAGRDSSMLQALNVVYTLRESPHPRPRENCGVVLGTRKKVPSPQKDSSGSITRCWPGSWWRLNASMDSVAIGQRLLYLGWSRGYPPALLCVSRTSHYILDVAEFSPELPMRGSWRAHVQLLLILAIIISLRHVQRCQTPERWQWSPEILHRLSKAGVSAITGHLHNTPSDEGKGRKGEEVAESHRCSVPPALETKDTSWSPHWTPRWVKMAVPGHHSQETQLLLALEGLPD